MTEERRSNKQEPRKDPGDQVRNAIRTTDLREQIRKWSSKKGRREDALALRAEERRDKLRKAAGRSKYPESRGSLNGETHMERLHVSMHE